MQDVRRSRTRQFEENAGVRPLLQSRQTRGDDDHSSEEFADSQNAEDVDGVAQRCVTIPTTGGPAMSSVPPCTRSVMPPTNVSRAMSVVATQYAIDFMFMPSREPRPDHQYFSAGRISTAPPNRAAGIRAASVIADSMLSASYTE